MRQLSLVFLTLFIFGCGPTPHYSELYELNSERWTSEEVVTFAPTIEDTTAVYELQLIIDHLTDYRYENIYFKIKTKFPDREDREENLSVNLATSTGAWVGKCSGEQCQCKIYLLENFKFPALGDYIFEISQYTRDENLAGLNSLEMQLFKVEEGERGK